MRKWTLSIVIGLAMTLMLGTWAFAQTPTATPEATATPTAVPTATPEATATPTAVPTATPEPTATPTAVPTATPTAVPTATPTAVPTATPTAVPTATATPAPTPTATPVPAVTDIEGKITAIDATAKTVTIAPDSGAAIVVNVVDTTEIEAPGKDSATLADLQVGQRVEARYETASRNALDIEVQKAKAGKIEGQITALDAVTNKVTVTPKQGNVVVLTVTAQTQIVIWGKDPATFADLKVGDSVRATYDVATSEAVRIQVNGAASQGARQGFFGTVKAKTDASLTLTTKQGDVTLVIDANTQFWNPPQKNATLADVKVGDRVAVLADKQGATLTAKRVLIIPAKPVRIQVTGTITKIDGTTVTITDQDGKTSTFDLPKGSVDKLAVGDVFTVTFMQTPGTGKRVAQGSMRGDEMRQRLNGFLDKVKGGKAGANGQQSSQAQELDKLGALMQRNMDQQQGVMQKVIDKAPAAAQAALQRARDNARQGWEQAKQALENARPTASGGNGKGGKK